MDKLPISTHITIVNAAPSSPPGAASGADSGIPSGTSADFSNLLAGQIAAKIQGLVKADAGGPAHASAKADAPADQASGAGNTGDTGVQIVAFLPISPGLMNGHIAKPEGSGDKNADVARVAKPDLTVEGANDLTDKQRAAAGSKQDLPARIAAESDALPLAHVSKQDGDGSPGSTDHVTPTPDFAQQMAAAKVEGATQTQAGQIPSATVETRVGAPGWDGEIGQKVVWMANQNHQIAEIHVTPPQLGPVEIRINISNDQANAMFVSPHASVRDAIEAALPRLREMLADNGLTLGNVTVSSQSFGHPQQGQNEAGRSHRGFVPDVASTSLDEGRLAAVMPGAKSANVGLVDIFA
jgi:flagellar hook-length control protein FliK